MKPALPPVILSSKSPRRHQLLRDAGINFRVVVREGLETYPDELTGADIAAWLCEQKADAMMDYTEENLVITADTIVCLGDRVLGKPADRGDAIRILKWLSGNRHTVVTGICLGYQQNKTIFTETTEVWFRPLSQEKIEWYIDHYPVMDRAGAYGIQDWVGLTGVEKINGDFYNVMGLPVSRLMYELEQRFQLTLQVPAPDGD